MILKMIDRQTKPIYFKCFLFYKYLQIELLKYAFIFYMEENVMNAFS